MHIMWNLERWYQQSYVQAAKETQMERTDFWTQWEKERVGRENSTETYTLPDVK